MEATAQSHDEFLRRFSWTYRRILVTEGISCDH
jgi:hypothetical protein